MGFALKKDRIEPDLGTWGFGQHSTDGGAVAARLGGGSCGAGVSSGLGCRGVEGFASSLAAAAADRLPYVRIGFLRCCVAGPVSTASADIVDLIRRLVFSSATVAIRVSIVEVWGEEWQRSSYLVKASVPFCLCLLSKTILGFCGCAPRELSVFAGIGMGKLHWTATRLLREFMLPSTALNDVGLGHFGSAKVNKPPESSPPCSPLIGRRTD